MLKFVFPKELVKIVKIYDQTVFPLAIVYYKEWTANV